MHRVHVQVDDTYFLDIGFGLGVLVDDGTRLVVLIERRRVADFPTQAGILQDVDGLFQRQVAHVGHLHLLAMGGEHVDKQQGNVAQRYQCQRHQCGIQQDGVAVTKAVKSAHIFVVVIAHGGSVV